jgi:hypothetical protein
LIDYILTTGDYNDPETRTSYSEETLEMLDVFGKRLGKPSVIKAREARATEFQEQKFVRDALNGLENIAGECVSQMYDAVEAVNEDQEDEQEATLRLLTNVIPVFEDAFAQIMNVDAEAARICASQWEAFLMGPTRKPTKDKKGFLKIVVELFHTACGQV